MATDSPNKDSVGRLPANSTLGKFTERTGGADKPDDVTPTPVGDPNRLNLPSGPGNGGGSASYTPKPVYGVYESPPDDNVGNVGYEVLVLAGPDYAQAIALVSSHQGLQLSRVLSGDGGGAITLNRDSPLFYNSPAAPTNLIPNPDFQTTNDGSYAWGWQVNSRSATATYGAVNQWTSLDGTTSTCLYIDTPGTGNARLNTNEGYYGIAVTPGVSMTATAQVRSPFQGRPVRLYVDYYGADSTFLGVGKSTYSYPVTTDPDVINFLQVEGLVPSNASYASVGVEVVATGVFNERHLFDNFSFHPTTSATPFYDGRDQSDIIDKENLWEVYYNGKRIHEFIGTVRSQDLVNASESRSVTISGVGTAELLKRVRVLPPAWTIKNGKPWVVSPIKLLKEDFSATNSDGGVALNTKVWNQKVTMNVAADTADFAYPKIQIMNVNPSQTEQIGSGPWNFLSDAKLPGDQSGIANTLFFEAFPYLLPNPGPFLDPDNPSSSVYLPADMTNVFEIYIDDGNRCYVDVRSIITDTGVQTHRLYCEMRGKTASGYQDDVKINAGTGGNDWIPYDVNVHKWFRFRMNAANTSIIVEYSPTGASTSWVQLATTSITNYPTWVSNLSQVTFRVFSYFTGIPHAYGPVSSRPIGGAGGGPDRAQQGYLPGTTGGLATALQPVGKITVSNELYDNPAMTSVGKINQGIDLVDQSPQLDQMGYFKTKGENAKASRAALAGVTFAWDTGDFRTGREVPAYDSIGNRRRGLTQSYFKDGSGSQVNALLVAPPVEAVVANLLAKPEGSYKKPDGKWYYQKYTLLVGAGTLGETEVYLTKVKITEPADGDAFYDYFVQSCTIAKCDWSMQPGRQLQIYDTDPLLVLPTLPNATILTDAREAYFKQYALDPTTGIPKAINTNVQSQTVFFHEGFTTIAKSVARSSESIVNYVIGHDSKGNYIVAQDKASIAKWGIREAWVDVDYAGDVTAVSLDTAVSTILAIGVNELESWTISVPITNGTYHVAKVLVTTSVELGAVGDPWLTYADASALSMGLTAANYDTTIKYVPVYNGDGTRPFVDYKEGDWVSVAKHTGADPSSSLPQYDLFRVISINLSVDVNGVETVELVLTSLVETRLKQLHDKLNNVSATSQVATAAIPPVSAYAQISSVSLGTLADVSVTGATPNSYLRLNAAGMWVAQPPESTPSPAATSYSTSDPLGDGTTSSFLITHNLKSVNVVIRVYAVLAGAGGTQRYGLSGGTYVNTTVGEEITNFTAFATTAPTNYTVPTSTHTHSVSGSSTGGPSANQTVPGTPALIKTAIPVIVDENHVRIYWSTVLPLKAPAASSFRVVVTRGNTAT